MLTNISAIWAPVAGATKYRIVLKKNGIVQVSGHIVTEAKYMELLDAANGDLIEVAVQSGNEAGFSDATVGSVTVSSVPVIPAAPSSVTVSDSI